MSDMLQQAIIDATALKEAAVRNAETLVLEKYSNEIKDAVETLLEQEDPAAALEPAGMDAAPAAEDQQEEAQVVEDLPLASLAEDLDEEIEIPLTNLMEELERMTGLKNLAGDFIGLFTCRWSAFCSPKASAWSAGPGCRTSAVVTGCSRTTS